MTYFVAEGHTHRALTYMPNGQAVSCWLPPGSYAVLGDCTCTDQDGAHHPMVQLERQIIPRELWYVAPSVLEGNP